MRIELHEKISTTDVTNELGPIINYYHQPEESLVDLNHFLL